jgi:flagellar basal-body rod protein FlgB
MLDRMTEAIEFQGKALALRARRQEVLSSNIANADTPGFKARDFDFAAALKQATAATASAGPTGAGTTTSSAAMPAGTAWRTAEGGQVVSTLSSGAQHTVRLARSQASHIGGVGGNAVEYGTRLQYATPKQGSLDGNSVDLDRERASFADNSLRYEATLRFINGRVRTMVTAIRGE